MRNQPKFGFMRNIGYSFSGLKDIVKNEKSFRVELAIFAILMPIVIFIEVSLVEKLLLFASMMGVLIAEAINSAIERVVDLVTLEHHDMAKRAKDAGSCIVLLSDTLAMIIWVSILSNLIFF